MSWCSALDQADLRLTCLGPPELALAAHHKALQPIHFSMFKLISCCSVLSQLCHTELDILHFIIHFWIFLKKFFQFCVCVTHRQVCEFTSALSNEPSLPDPKYFLILKYYLVYLIWENRYNLTSKNWTSIGWPIWVIYQTAGWQKISETYTLQSRPC